MDYQIFFGHEAQIIHEAENNKGGDKVDQSTDGGIKIPQLAMDPHTPNLTPNLVREFFPESSVEDTNAPENLIPVLSTP